MFTTKATETILYEILTAIIQYALKISDETGLSS